MAAKRHLFDVIHRSKVLGVNFIREATRAMLRVDASTELSSNRSLALERLAIDLGIPVVGEAVLSRDVIRALATTPFESLEVTPWRHYLSRDRREARPFVRRSAGPGASPGSLRVFVRQPFDRLRRVTFAPLDSSC